MSRLHDQLVRHIHACRSATIPGQRVPFRTAGRQVGWILHEDAQALRAYGAELDQAGGGVTVAPDALQSAMHALSKAGRFRWRDERFDVRGHDGSGPVLATVDRGALPVLGIVAWGAHLNGLVRRGNGDWHLWVGRRADDRPLDPGKLDNLTAGGVPAGLTPLQTLFKEGQEEASLPEALLRGAAPVATIGYEVERAEGLRRDRLACFDLVLPDSFEPIAQDQEIAGFALWPIQDVLDRVLCTDDFKFNVNLVLIDLFIRLGIVQGDDALRLGRALYPDRLQAA